MVDQCRGHRQPAATIAGNLVDRSGLSRSVSGRWPRLSRVSWSISVEGIPPPLKKHSPKMRVPYGRSTLPPLPEKRPPLPSRGTEHGFRNPCEKVG